jgi:hypothetical protein
MNYTGPTPSLFQGTEPVTWSLQAGPGGMTIDQNTGVVSWASPTMDGSPHNITIRAENSEGYDDESWLLTVTPASEPTNVALGKPAAQSSTGWGGTADRAVDDNPDGNWFNGSVSSTGPDTEDQPWWQVDLSDSYQIQEIKVYKRTDDCGYLLSDFYVLVSDQPFQSTDLNTVLAQEGVWSYFHAGEADLGQTISVGSTGRYVRVQLVGSGTWLQIGELEVWGM